MNILPKIFLKRNLVYIFVEPWFLLTENFFHFFVIKIEIVPVKSVEKILKKLQQW